MRKARLPVLFAILQIIARCPTRASAADRILIVTAVDYEYAAVAGLLEDRHEALLGGRQLSEGAMENTPVVVIRSGWGKAQAAGAASEAIEKYAPALVVMAGVAGGIDLNNVESGDVIIVSNTFQYDLGEFINGSVSTRNPETPMEGPLPDLFASSSSQVTKAVEAAKMAHFVPWRLPPSCKCEKDGRRTDQCKNPEQPVGRDTPKVCSGTVASGDAFVIDVALGATLLESRNAVAVDMETAAVAEEAADRQLPFVAVRIVGDVVGSGDNESLYYCLKPLAGPRLAETMRRVIPALAKDVPRSSSETNNVAEAMCRPELLPAAKQQALLKFHTAMRSSRPIRLR